MATSIYFLILKEWKRLWELRYSGRVFTPRNFHYKQLKDALKPAEGFENDIDINEVVEKMKIYLKNNFYQVCAHNLSVMLRNYDNFVPPPPRRAAATVACRHCGEIYRVNDQHRCSYEGGGVRQDKPAVPLQSLLPKAPEQL